MSIALILLCINQIYFLRYVYLYQLESYELIPFIKLVCKKFNVLDYVFFLVNLMLFMLLMLFCCETLLILLCVINLVYFTVLLINYYKNLSNFKIKLKYTKRVLRCNLLYTFVEFVTIIITIMTKTYNLCILLIFNILLFLISTFADLPIEKFIHNYYIRKTQKVLNANKNLKIIAITGSYGKTSVKNILYEILSQKDNVLATPMSYNTPMGICKCIRSELKPYHEYLILEFGAKRVGEIKYLCEKFKPNYAIISSIGPQHIETFGNMDNIIKTKMELYDYIVDKSNCVCNVSNTYIRDYLTDRQSDCQRVVFEDDNTSDVLLRKNTLQLRIEKCDRYGSKFCVLYGGETEQYNTKLLGVHNVINVGLAIAMSKKLGISYNQIVCGLANVIAIKHRLELKDMGDYLLIDNAYNSNPNSFRCAIDTLCLFSDMIKIVVTPGVIDQGANGYRENYELGRYMADKVDFVYLVNKTNRRALYEGLTSAGMNDDKIFIFDNFSDLEWKDFGEGEIVLIENDLPDNFD